MKFSKKSELLLLFVVVVIFINFVFYKYGHTLLSEKKIKIANKVNILNSDIANEINIYNSNLGIFNKIITIKRETTVVEESLILLKTKVKTDVQVSEVIKSLILKSGIQVHNLVLGNISNEKGKMVYSFDLSVEGSLSSLVKLLENIDNKNELLKVNTYSMGKKENIYTMGMKISTVYQDVGK